MNNELDLLGASHTLLEGVIACSQSYHWYPHDVFWPQLYLGLYIASDIFQLMWFLCCSLDVCYLVPWFSVVRGCSWGLSSTVVFSS